MHWRQRWRTRHCCKIWSVRIPFAVLLVVVLLAVTSTKTTQAFSVIVVPSIARPQPQQQRQGRQRRLLTVKPQCLSVHQYDEAREYEPDTLFTDPLEREYVVAEPTIWENLAMAALGDMTLNLSIDSNNSNPEIKMRAYVQLVTIFRVGIPALINAALAKLVYPIAAMALADAIDDAGVFAVVAQDASQYIQNVLTTSGLVFSLLVGQTYYFMYQQQEATYLALYEEVTMAKSLLEQVALVCQGRQQLYRRILEQMDRYCRYDLRRFNDVEPAILLSARPSDDPLEDILYLTSVGEPSVVYQTVRALRKARAYRLAALQKKLPSIHMTLLWVLAGIVLFTFPLLGAGVQTIGGDEILQVQSWYLGFIVLAISLVMGVVYELQRPGETGAYNARMVLAVMVTGLEEELHERLAGRDDFHMRGSLDGAVEEGPSIDGDGSFDQILLHSRSGDSEILT